MRRYETIYILRPSLGEGEITTTIDNSNAIITGDKGQIIELDKWGMRKLAYPINKEIQGFYVYCDYSGTPEAVAEMERKFRIDDAVLRYMTVKTADFISDEGIAEATSQAAAKQEAATQEETDATAETTDTTEKTKPVETVETDKVADKAEVSENDEAADTTEETSDAAEDTQEEKSKE